MLGHHQSAKHTTHQPLEGRTGPLGTKCDVNEARSAKADVETRAASVWVVRFAKADGEARAASAWVVCSAKADGEARAASAWVVRRSKNDPSHLKHAELLRVVRGWAVAVAEAEAGQSQDDRWSVSCDVGVAGAFGG